MSDKYAKLTKQLPFHTSSIIIYITILFGLGFLATFMLLLALFWSLLREILVSSAAVHLLITNCVCHLFCEKLQPL